MYSGIPFWKIKRKSRIVFYGCGRNSSVCYKQLIENGYCVFAGVVDRNPKGKSLDGNMAQSIEKLKDLHYDAILITIVNEKIVQSVKEEMLNNGVPLEKINTLFDLDQALSIEQLKLNNYFENYMEQTYQTRKSCARKSCEYYSGLQALFAEQNDFDELFVELKKIITKTPNNEFSLFSIGKLA